MKKTASDHIKDAQTAYKEGRQALLSGKLETARVKAIQVGERALRAKKAGISQREYDRAIRARDALIGAYHATRNL